MNKLLKALQNPRKVLARIFNALPTDGMNDKPFIKIAYWLETGGVLDLKNPRTFNEKIQWLKLYDRRSEYGVMADKYAARQHVAKTLGAELLIPLIGGPWTSFKEIDFRALPDQFVLKCTHDSGGVIICEDKSRFDIPAAEKTLGGHLRRNWYLQTREWPYRNIKPRIIAERYMTDESGSDLTDYKVFCFDGVPRAIMVCLERSRGCKRILYTPDWEHIPGTIGYDGEDWMPTAPEQHVARPPRLDDLLAFSRRLSKGLPHLRADWYCVGDAIYFGEMTFYHGSGMFRFYPQDLGLEMGSWLTLPPSV